MSKSDRCSSCRVLSDAFADQFHSCLLILLVLSPLTQLPIIATTNTNLLKICQNFTNPVSSLLSKQICLWKHIPTASFHSCLPFSPFSSLVPLQCSIPLLHFHFLPFTFTLSLIMFILTVSNSVISLRRHIQLPWSSRETLAIERLQFQSSRFHLLWVWKESLDLQILPRKLQSQKLIKIVLKKRLKLHHFLFPCLWW